MCSSFFNFNPNAEFKELFNLNPLKNSVKTQTKSLLVFFYKQIIQKVSLNSFQIFILVVIYYDTNFHTSGMKIYFHILTIYNLLMYGIKISFSFFKYITKNKSFLIFFSFYFFHSQYFLHEMLLTATHDVYEKQP